MDSYALPGSECETDNFTQTIRMMICEFHRMQYIRRTVRDSDDIDSLLDMWSESIYTIDACSTALEAYARKYIKDRSLTCMGLGEFITKVQDYALKNRGPSITNAAQAQDISSLLSQLRKYDFVQI